MNKYSLLLKTGDSELRALSHFPNIESVFPIVELTRGRKSKKDKIGQISKRIDKIKDIFKNEEIILDLTSEESLSNSEIDSFFVPTDGYSNWIAYLLELQNKKYFKKLIPSIVVNGTDEDFYSNLKKQADSIAKNFKCMAYRCDIEDDECVEDISSIKEYLNSNESYIIVDNGYIQPSDVLACAKKSSNIIKEVSRLVPKTTIILSSTSFPDKLPIEDEYTLPLSEIDLYNEVNNLTNNIPITYSDYGGINPIRNDEVIMAHGWRPRVDVPLYENVFYYRKKRDGQEYSKTYSLVARKAANDLRFPNQMKDNWGIQQITNAANGAAPGSNPSFWISVRMNIHIEQQLRRLKLL